MITLEPPRRLPGGAAQPDPWRALGLSRTGLSRFLQTAQAAVGLRGEVDVLLAGNRTLRRLNREFRGKDSATDVLSFPSLGFAPAGNDGDGEHAGDLAISLETAANQAREHGHSLRDEVRVLLLHGLLHLAGMDHETDHGEMAAREAALRESLRLPGGLIERAAKAPPSSKSARGSGAPRASERASRFKNNAARASGARERERAEQRNGIGA